MKNTTKRLTAVLALAIALTAGIGPASRGLQFDEAISRAYTVFNGPQFDEAISRACTVFNGPQFDEAISRAYTVFNGPVFHEAISRAATVCNAAGPPCPEDFNADGEVGPFDLAVLLGAWGPCEEACEPLDPPAPACTCAVDLSGDCAIGPFDLALLLGNWGPCE